MNQVASAKGNVTVNHELADGQGNVCMTEVERSLSGDRLWIQPNTSYVELVVVVDKSLYTRIADSSSTSSTSSSSSDVGKFISRRVRAITNVVNALYRPIGIIVVLTHLEIWSDEDKIEVVEGNSSSTLSHFNNYYATFRREAPLVPMDNMQLLTGVSFENDTVGKATVSAMCGPGSVGVSMDAKARSHALNPRPFLNPRQFLGTAETLVHEMGHNLGLNHVNETEGCACEDMNCIMLSRGMGCVQVWGGGATPCDAHQAERLNVKGDKWGSCGYVDRAKEELKPCAVADAECGTLFCHTPAATPPTAFFLYRTSWVSEEGCVAVIPNNTYPQSLWLVPDGAPCGDGKMCINQHCSTRPMAIATIVFIIVTLVLALLTLLLWDHIRHCWERSGGRHFCITHFYYCGICLDTLCFPCMNRLNRMVVSLLPVYKCPCAMIRDTIIKPLCVEEEQEEEEEEEEEEQKEEEEEEKKRRRKRKKSKRRRRRRSRIGGGGAELEEEEQKEEEEKKRSRRRRRRRRGGGGGGGGEEEEQKRSRRRRRRRRRGAEGGGGEEEEEEEEEQKEEEEKKKKKRRRRRRS
ncbi:Snake venom metalloproteinase HF-1 [Chionoecetes opilio]|uniref:Snake venom metalloproteinase HF-1 n=1 Tax=Chionoecetes opilio TaxID=41210 RepID=A0A8J4YDW6_CHIOP|nr:Snake venom metalloproteinase HF-1 [Chionoecetes opilio]